MTAPDEFEATLGLQFNDPSLLQRALTHRSYLNEHPDYNLPHNERLEFLGDAIVDFVVGELLFHRFPEMQEGDLTGLRAALVRTEALAALARQINLGPVLLIGRGEETSGGRDRPLLLAGAFEALVGAIYLDQGLPQLRTWLLALVQPEAQRLAAGAFSKDAKSQLQELAQAELGHTPHYRTVSEIGPDHAKEFTVQVLVGEQVLGEGRGRSKQVAAQAAAADALSLLQQRVHGEEEESQLLPDEAS
jgi:ribonuclease-3